jgi:hypothetical protein
MVTRYGIIGQVNNRAWATLTERASHLDIHDRIVLVIMWGSLIVFGPPGLVLTLLNDPVNLPIAFVVIVGGSITAVTVTVLKVFPKRRVSRVPEQAESHRH